MLNLQQSVWLIVICGVTVGYCGREPERDLRSDISM